MATTIRTPRARRAGSIACAVLLVLSLTLGVTAQWARMTVFDSARFAQRASEMLDSPVVRSTLADQLTQVVVDAGPSSLASFQTVIRSALDPIMQTPTFRRMFRRALDNAHDYLFTRDGAAAVINLSQALSVLSGSLAVTNPDVANALPDGSTQLLVDVGDNVRNLQLWRISERLSIAGIGLLTLSVVLGAGVVLLDRDRRRGVFVLGAAIVIGGAIMSAAAIVAPPLAASFTSNAEISRATHAAVDRFLGDYRVLAFLCIVLGAMVGAFASLRASIGEQVTFGNLASTVRRLAADHRPTTRKGHIASSIALIAVGVAMVELNTAIVPLVVELAGAVIAFVGASQLLTLVGRTADPSMEAAGGSTPMVARSRRIPIALTMVALLAILGLSGWFAIAQSSANTAAGDVRTCNGAAELCDRTIDQVAFLGSHNAMSTSTDPGWLFYEQNRSIPAQLSLGVRALLVKTHYGIPTTVSVTGAPLVVTDALAEVNVGTEPGDDAYTTEARDRAKQLQSTVKVDPKLRDVYLCHVYCEYGATKFSTALGYVRQFLTANPDNVIILVIGDYVSRDDTLKAFRTAKLESALWEYDPSAPLPTLGQLIDGGHNVVMMSEFSGPPPAWNIRAYGTSGLVQDTPFTFRRDAELFAPGSPRYTGDAVVDGPIDATITSPAGVETFSSTWTGLPSCAPNRGAPSSPMFQVNHWVTPAGSSPTVDQARVVNAYDVLMPRIRDCAAQRARFPAIIGVNFVGVGDAVRVVAELNGVG